MSTPRFSILVPTRERPATLRHTLATLAEQPGDDYEIVVADNCGGPETRAIVEALDQRKLRYLRSDEVLPMSVNWERGLEQCAGEYVTVLGDDDGLVPGALDMARRLLDATQAEIASWSPHVYWWPDSIVPWSRNVLIMNMGDGLIQCGSRQVLREFYERKLSFSMLPQIYCGFFHRGIIEDARIRYDAFFTPPDAAPDIASAILGLHITEGYVYSMRPLSIRGNSGKSNGTAQWMRSLGAEARAAYFRDERKSLEAMTHPALVPSPALEIVIANAMLKCKDAYFPQDDALQVDLRKLLHDMLAGLNREPEAYDDNLRDAQALAAKLGVRLAPADIPAKQPIARKREWGPAVNDNKVIGQLGVNCDLAKAFNIAEAAQLVEAILPAAGFLEQR
jgi:glycosyltransferase involved in cell wall biosynthesis